MTRRSAILPALAMLPLLAVSVAAKPSGIIHANLATPNLNGKALFKEKCVMCHDATGMGTGLLARRTKPAMLTKRGDLTVNFVIQAARTGIGNMPALTRGEVSDPQLKAIAEYLSKGPYPKAGRPAKASEEK